MAPSELEHVSQVRSQPQAPGWYLDTSVWDAQFTVMSSGALRKAGDQGPSARLATRGQCCPALVPGRGESGCTSAPSGARIPGGKTRPPLCSACFSRAGGSALSSSVRPRDASQQSYACPRIWIWGKQGRAPEHVGWLGRFQVGEGSAWAGAARTGWGAMGQEPGVTHKYTRTNVHHTDVHDAHTCTQAHMRAG